MNTSQRSIAVEIERLTQNIERKPEEVRLLAEDCANRSSQVLYLEGEIRCLIIIARCAGCLMDYKSGIKTIKRAHAKLNTLDTYDLLPEIYHVYALLYTGQAKYFSAQQYWINALEQSTLVDQIEIQIESLVGLGNIWRITHEVNLARKTHELAVMVANNRRLTKLEGKARLLLARDHYSLGNYAEMLSILDSASELSEHCSNWIWQAELWDYRGLALLGLERTDDADSATKKAHELAIENNCLWMQVQCCISRSKVKLARNHPENASTFLSEAAQYAAGFDDSELMREISYYQSIAAEKLEDYQSALKFFQQYREYSLNISKEQTVKVANDRIRTSKQQLQQKAARLINRIRRQYEYDPDKHLNQMVAETYWWQKLVVLKTELKHTKHSVIIVYHPDSNYIDVCAELTHSLCNKNDILSRLSGERLGILLDNKSNGALEIYQILAQMFSIYPWQRKGLKGSKPQVTIQDVLTFPLTLEQLENYQSKDNGDGSST